MNKPYVLVFGASVVDMFGFCKTAYRSHDSIPGKIKISFGGVSRNIAENMARIGVNTRFVSILGNDEVGEAMLKHSQQIGYDMSDSLILKDKSTPTYMAILNENGEMVSAVADLESIKAMTTEFIDTKAEIIAGAQYTFVDADDPKTLEYLLTNFSGKTNFILDPISTTKAIKIKHLLKHFHTIKPNRFEAEALSGMEIVTYQDLKKVGNYFLSLGIKKVFISLDGEGVYYTDGRFCGKIKAKNADVVNVTGAGDSFVAGLGHCYMNELETVEGLKYAIAMSLITISHQETIHPEMGPAKVEETLKEIEWEELHEEVENAQLFLKGEI